MLLKNALSAAVPAMIAVIAFLHAHAVGALIDASSTTAASVAPFAEARAATAPPAKARGDAETILARNVFDHTATPAQKLIGARQTADAPSCEGVRALVSVRVDENDASFAALDVGGKRYIRRRGGFIDGLAVVFVGTDRVWLAQNGVVCQARIFGAEPPKRAARTASAFEQEIGAKIQKTGPNEYAIDRGAVARLLEAQTELMKTPLAPEKENDRVVGYRLVRVKPGSVLSLLGLESGDRLEAVDGVAVTSPEGMMQAYARLSTGTLERLTIRVTRAGKPTSLDYTIK
ncbi:MAG: hypothetical protein KIT84_01285 [Labilithrix sp.]|nr:hypothetical protein [Labilithrix sp.]MCW5809619.1 hypothetical protein [Labilithrix sp.]